MTTLININLRVYGLIVAGVLFNQYLMAQELLNEVEKGNKRRCFEITQ